MTDRKVTGYTVADFDQGYTSRKIYKTDEPEIKFNPGEPLEVFRLLPMKLINEKCYWFHILSDNAKIVRIYEISVHNNDMIPPHGYDLYRYCALTKKMKVVRELALEDLIDLQVQSVLNERKPVFELTPTCKAIETGIGHGAYIFNNDNKAKIGVSNSDYSVTEINIGGDEAVAVSDVPSARLSAITYDCILATSSDHSTLTAIGRGCILASTGDEVSMTASGNASFLVATGNKASLMSSGDVSTILATGDNATLVENGTSTRFISTGAYARLNSSGRYSALCATGDQSTITIDGYHAFCEALGQNNTINILDADSAIFTGVKGTIVNVVDNNHRTIVGCIGENGLRENTNYTVKNGQFIEMPTMDDNA